MSGLLRKWKGVPLAVKILICMVAGVATGLILHGLNDPLPADDPQLLREALLQVDGFTPEAYDRLAGDDGSVTPQEWTSWLQAQRGASVDANGDGVLDRAELGTWEASDKLTPAVLDRLEIVYNQVIQGIGASVDESGQLTKYGLTRWMEALEPKDEEVLIAVRKARDRVAGGVGKPIASVVAIIGDLFLGLIRAVVIPLVFVAVFVGIAGNDDVATVKKVGFGILFYFLFTTFIAVSLGALLTILIKPGAGMPPDFREKGMAEAGAVVTENNLVLEAADISLREKVQQFIPGNLFTSLSTGAMLDIVLFAALFGAVVLVLREAQATALRDRANVLVGWGNFILEICMTVVRWAMLLAPYAVFGLMADITAQVGLEVLAKLFKYTATVLLGLVLLLVFYGVIVATVGKRSPVDFFKNLWELQLLAFSTSSSAAVMPRSLDTAENKLGVHRAISRFTIPLGATINMDGTALYQAVGTIFLMQVFGKPVEFGSVGLILGTAILASIGTPGTPGVGIIVLAGILQSNGLPASGIALIFGVDRILDMCRTTINVTGDQTACIVMERLAGARLEELHAEGALASATGKSPSV